MKLVPKSLYSLENIIPQGLHPEFKLREWAWIPNLTNTNSVGVLDLATDDIIGELKNLNALYEETMKKAMQSPSPAILKEAERYLKIKKQINDREILGFLGVRNVLPKYGFPADVVELKTDHLYSIEQAQDVDLGP